MSVFAYIVWNVDPVLLRLGPLQIRYYGILFALGFLIGYYLFRYFFKKEKVPLSELDKLFWYVILGAIIGARLGHVLFYEPDYYFSNPLEIFAIWHGGLASHGGAIGLLIALYLYSRKSFNKDYLYILDRMAIPTALAGSFIRLGNLFNSEIYGRPTELPWGFIFVRDGQTIPCHPTQIYEALAYLLIFIFLFYLYKKYNGNLPRGLAIGWMLLLTFLARFLIEFIKLPQVGFETNLINTIGLNMGQLLSLPFIIVGIWLIIKANKSKKLALKTKKA